VTELLLRGHSVTIYTVSYDLSEEQQYTWGNLRLFVGPARQLGAARDFFRPEIGYLRRVIRADHPDFIHAHWTYEFALGALGSGLPTLVTIHDLPWNVLRYFRDRYRTARLLMAYAVAIRATRYTAVSKDAARHFARYMRPGTKVRAIPNFLTQNVLSKGSEPKKHPRRPLVFAVVLQGWTPRKNAKVALKAHAIVRRAYPSICLHVIGADYEVGGPASNWVAEHHLGEGVHFLGLLQYENMLNHLSKKVDVLVMPSLDEALSMTVLENMALANPIIAGASTPGIREELAGGEAGILVDVRSPDAVARAMIRLQNDPAHYERVSRSAYERAHTTYTAESVLPLYEQAYASLLEETKSEQTKSSETPTVGELP
jgi:glycosyltransferase involved in cell wall biosynthesis